LKVLLITGGAPHYEQGLISGLVQNGVKVHVIGGEELETGQILGHPSVEFQNLRGRNYSKRSAFGKVWLILTYYYRLLTIVLSKNCKLIHIQWPYKLAFLDQTIFPLFYRIIGKRVIFTAHNIDQDARDKKSSIKNKIALWTLYNAVHHIIVHTDLMKAELIASFRVNAAKISVIPHGLMTAVPEVGLTREAVRRSFGIGETAPTILFFGMISPYKGLSYLIDALPLIRRKLPAIQTIIGGRIKDCPDYWTRIERSIQEERLAPQLKMRLEHIPDEEVEAFFKCADLLVMPYTSIFQSGVLFLGYRFGLPIVATDVGSLKEDIVDGQTGFVTKAGDAKALAETIIRFFESELYRDLPALRERIKSFAEARYSWDTIGKKTRELYEAVAHV
jgi:D-inositol-3-phosphate glycosyltransferase